MPRSFVEQALARCSVAGSKFWFNCNPAGASHWFYQEWVQKTEEKNLLYLHFTMEDNPSLSPGVRRRYERMYTGAFYDRYIRGLWRAADGVIYDMFDPARHIVKQNPPTGGGCIVSVDYGTQNPTVFLKWRRCADGRWLCEDEYYWSGRDNRRQKTDGDYADDLARFLQGERPRTVIVDPSAASFIAELSRRGYAVQRADNRVSDGIRLVGELLQSGEVIFSERCVHTQAEFSGYAWDSAAAQRGEDKPLKEHDHCMDALRYFAMTAAGRASARVRRRPGRL